MPTSGPLYSIQGNSIRITMPSGADGFSEARLLRRVVGSRSEVKRVRKVRNTSAVLVVTKFTITDASRESLILRIDKALKS